MMTTKSGITTMALGLALLLCGCASTHSVVGSVHASTYTSEQGGFSVPFPVSSDVGGRIRTDDAKSVTFCDNWGSRITFTGLAILEHSSMTTMLETQGREKALSEFARREYGDMSAIHYHADVREGTISFIYLRPNSPKTAVAIFTYGRRLYLVETDILPGVQLLAQNDEASQRERETWLEGRAVALAQTMEVN
ncbi:MAG TPA: hypothetical protein VGR14_10460 [Verrucomicrobiae bacterium]|jgi:hypothetical protein|nr:hypothetical protein [Verrucomicrobiae bacterium]